MEIIVSNIETYIQAKEPFELEKQLCILNEELNQKLMNLSKLTITKIIRRIKYEKKKNLYTVYNKC